MPLVLYTVSVVTLFYISTSVVARGKLVVVMTKSSGTLVIYICITLDGSEVGDCPVVVS